MLEHVPGYMPEYVLRHKPEYMSRHMPEYVLRHMADKHMLKRMAHAVPMAYPQRTTD